VLSYRLTLAFRFAPPTVGYLTLGITDASIVGFPLRAAELNLLLSLNRKVQKEEEHPRRMSLSKLFAL